MRENDKGLYLDRARLIFLVSGIFLISALSFFLGYIVNSGCEDKCLSVKSDPAESGGRFSGPVPESEKEASPASVAVYSDVALPDKKTELVKESELTFFKSLSQVHSGTSGSVSVKKTATPEKKSVKHKKESAKPEKRLRVIKESKKNSAVTNVSRMFTIQVASVKNRRDAFALKTRIERQGYDSYIMIFSKNDTRWYRIRVGAVNSVEEAGALLDKLKAAGNPGAYIARYTR